MKEISDHTLSCLRDEKERLMDDVRRCDFCSTSTAEHSHCYEETARESGRRSKACLN
jgi:hypothetical protein